jgi:hypothetical protein
MNEPPVEQPVEQQNEPPVEPLIEQLSELQVDQPVEPPKRNKKKGYRGVLIGLIVVAVVVVIAVPLAYQHIDKTDDGMVISEGKTIQIALQNYITKEASAGSPVEWSGETGGSVVMNSAGEQLTIASHISNLADQDYTSADISEIYTSGAAIYKFVYHKEDRFVGYNANRDPEYKIALSAQDAIQ